MAVAVARLRRERAVERPHCAHGSSPRTYCGFAARRGCPPPRPTFQFKVEMGLSSLEPITISNRMLCCHATGEDGIPSTP